MTCATCHASCPDLGPGEQFCGECGHAASAHAPSAPPKVVAPPSPSRTGTGWIVFIGIALVVLFAMYYANQGKSKRVSMPPPAPQRSEPARPTEERPGVPSAPPLGPWQGTR